MADDSAQARMDAFTVALCDRVNNGPLMFTEIRSKLAIENLAREHGVKVSVTFDENGRMNITPIFEQPICRLTTTGSYTPEPKDARYLGLLENMRRDHGHKLGTFLANRAATLLRKLEGEIVTHIEVCELGNPFSELAYKRAIADAPLGYRSGTFEFKHKVFGKTLSTSRYRIGVCYAD